MDMHSRKLCRSAINNILNREHASINVPVILELELSEMYDTDN